MIRKHDSRTSIGSLYPDSQKNRQKKKQKNKLVKHSQTNSINESEQVNTNFIPSNEPPVQIASEQNLLAWFRCTFNEIYQRMSEIYKYWVLSKIIFSSLGFACFHGLVEHLFEREHGSPENLVAASQVGGDFITLRSSPFQFL